MNYQYVNLRLKLASSPINVAWFVFAFIALPFNMFLSAALCLFGGLIVWRTPIIREGFFLQNFDYIKQTLLTISKADGKKQPSLISANLCSFDLQRFSSSQIKELLKAIAKLDPQIQQVIFSQHVYFFDFFSDAFRRLSIDDKRDIVNFVRELKRDVQRVVWNSDRLRNLFLAASDESDEFCKELMYTLAVCYQNKVIDYNPMLEFLKHVGIFAGQLDRFFQYDEPDDVIKYLWLGKEGKDVVDILTFWNHRVGSGWLYDQVLDLVFSDNNLANNILTKNRWNSNGTLFRRGLDSMLTTFCDQARVYGNPNPYIRVFNWLKEYGDDEIWASMSYTPLYSSNSRYGSRSIWEAVFDSAIVTKREIFSILKKLPKEEKDKILYGVTLIQTYSTRDNFLLRLLRENQSDTDGLLEALETEGLVIWESKDLNGNTAFSNALIVQSEAFGLEVLNRIDTLDRQEKAALMIQKMFRGGDGSNTTSTEGQSLSVVDKLLLNRCLPQNGHSSNYERISTWAHVCNREARLGSEIYEETINRFKKFDSKTKVSLLQDLLKLYASSQINKVAIALCLRRVYPLSTNFEIKKAIDIIAECSPNGSLYFNAVIRLLPEGRRQEISEMLPGLYYQNSWLRYSLFSDSQERSNIGNSSSSQRQVSTERMAETLWGRTDGFSRDMEPSCIKKHRAFVYPRASLCLAQFLSQEDRHALRAVSKNPVDHDTQDDHDKISHTNDQALPPCN